MEWYYILLVIPAILITLFGYHNQRNGTWYSRVTTKELTISLAANFLVALLCLGAIQMFKYGKVHDYYILNGVITNKYSEKVSCEHSYQICTTSGKVTTCVTHYEHSYDVDWVVETSIGNLNIDRVNRRGTEEPPRFSAVRIGEPSAKEVSYSNYLFADPESLFVQNAKGGFGVSTAKVFDYYRTTHFLGVPEYHKFEEYLKMLLVNKKYNITFVTVKNKPVESFYDLTKDWRGGKINEITFVINLGGNNEILWVKGNSYAKGYKNQLMLKTVESILTENNVTQESLKQTVDIVDKTYILHSEHEFEEKIDLVEIPLFLVLFLTLFNFGVSIVIHNKMKTSNI